MIVQEILCEFRVDADNKLVFDSLLIAGIILIRFYFEKPHQQFLLATALKNRFIQLS